jgi:hypothetical protein
LRVEARQKIWSQQARRSAVGILDVPVFGHPVDGRSVDLLDNGSIARIDHKGTTSDLNIAVRRKARCFVIDRCRERPERN